MTIFILDACALIAYFSKENGAENIKEIFKQAIDSNAKIYMSKVNLLEVYYDTIKKGNEKNADKMLKIVEQMPIEIIHEISDTVLKKAGLLKSKYGGALQSMLSIKCFQN